MSRTRSASVLAGLAMVGTVSAQAITWGPVNPTLAPTDVSLNGALVAAANFQRPAVAAISPTVNGVTFVGLPAAPGWTGWVDTGLGSSTTGNTEYNRLLNNAQATSGPTGNPTGWGAIRIDTMAALVPGHTYEIQVWFTDQRPGSTALYDRVMTLSSAFGPAGTGTLAGGELTNLGALTQGATSLGLDGDPDNFPALGSPDQVFGSHCLGQFGWSAASDELWLLIQGSHPIGTTLLRPHITALQVRDLTAAYHQPFGTGCHAPSPLTLSAAPAPILNPSTIATYSIGNIPETAPGSGVYLSALILSVTPFPTGLDLLGILTTTAGCKLYLGSLDVILGPVVTAAPSSALQLTFSAPVFAPGNVIGAQAVGFFDGSFPLPNGEASGFVFSNGVISTTQLQ